MILENYPEDQTEDVEAVNNPEDPNQGTRRLPFSRELYIESDDFCEDPPKKFFRLTPGKEVRLRYAYIIRCVGVIKDERTGEVLAVRCTYDPDTKRGGSEAGRKVKGTIHWVSTTHAIPAEVRLYEPLLRDSSCNAEDSPSDSEQLFNPRSLQILSNCWAESSLKDATVGSRFQFERQGYFCLDQDSSDQKLVFNRTVSLRDSWAKIKEK